MKYLSGHHDLPYWIVANMDQIRLDPFLKDQNWEPVVPEFAQDATMHPALKSMQLNRVRLFIGRDNFSQNKAAIIVRTLLDRAFFVQTNLPSSWDFAKFEVLGQLDQFRKKQHA